MKKLFITFLCVVMVLVFMPTMAFATGGTPVEVDTAAELAGAVANSQGGTIKLTANVTVSSVLEVNGNKEIVLDLNGFEITGGAEVAQIFFVKEGGSLEVTGAGKVTAVNEAFRLIGNCATGGEPVRAALVVGADVSVESAKDCSVYMRGNGSKADIYGELLSKGKYATIQGNGTVNGTNDYGNTVVNIHKGASVVNENNLGIYQPQKGTLNVDGTVKGTTAIEVRAGSVEVGMNAFIIATAEEYASAANGNGSASSGGGALVVAQHTTKLPIDVTIKGGIMYGPYALIADDVQNPEGVAEEVDIAIEGGIFMGKAAVKGDGGKISIVKCGTFHELDESNNVTISDEIDAIAEVTSNEARAPKLKVFGSEFLQAGLNFYKEMSAEERESLNISYNILKAKEGLSLEVPDGIKVENSTQASIIINDKPLAKNETVTVGDKTTEDNKQENKPANEVPKTGDANTMLPWLAIMALAAGTAAAMKRRED